MSDVGHPPQYQCQCPFIASPFACRSRRLYTGSKGPFAWCFHLRCSDYMHRRLGSHDSGQGKCRPALYLWFLTSVLYYFSFSAAGCTSPFESRWFLVLRNTHRSFFQGLCALGYCVAPLDIAALISCFVRTIYVRAPIAILAWAWCIWGELRTPL